LDNEEHHAVLHPYNPLSFDIKTEVNPCIFKGNLLKEPNTEVLVTGGCYGADSFEVSCLGTNLFKITHFTLDVILIAFDDQF
jgi:hypothetical protein